MTDIVVFNNDAGMLHPALAGCKLEPQPDGPYAQITDPFGREIGVYALTEAGDEEVSAIHFDRGGSILFHVGERLIALRNVDAKAFDALIELMRPGLVEACEAVNLGAKWDEECWEEDAVIPMLEAKIAALQDALDGLKKGQPKPPLER